MSERSTGEQTGAELPPGWTALNATTAAGHLYVAVWRTFRDATPFEYGCAMAPPPDLGWLHPGDAVARVRALRQAQGGRADLPEDVWQRCVRLVYPTLSEHERQDPKEILTAIAVFQPRRDDNAVAQAPLARRGPGRPPWTEELFLERHHDAQARAALPGRLVDVAARFRALDGTIGMDPSHLRRLRRKFARPAEISE